MDGCFSASDVTVGAPVVVEGDWATVPEGGVYDPTTIAGMIGWWDADSLDATHLDKIEYVEDLSGSGNHMLASAPTSGPTFTDDGSGPNGLPFLDFDGSEWLYPTGGAAGLGPLTAVTIYAVARATGGSGIFISINRSTGADQYSIGFEKSANNLDGRARASGWDSAEVLGGPDITAAATLMRLRAAEGTQFDTRAGNVSASDANPSGGWVNHASNADAGIGETWDGAKYPLEFCEMLVYDHVVDGESDTQVTDYLNEKWGLA